MERKSGSAPGLARALEPEPSDTETRGAGLASSVVERMTHKPPQGVSSRGRSTGDEPRWEPRLPCQRWVRHSATRPSATGPGGRGYHKASGGGATAPRALAPVAYRPGTLDPLTHLELFRSTPEPEPDAGPHHRGATTASASRGGGGVAFGGPAPPNRAARSRARFPPCESVSLVRAAGPRPLRVGAGHPGTGAGTWLVGGGTPGRTACLVPLVAVPRPLPTLSWATTGPWLCTAVSSRL